MTTPIEVLDENRLEERLRLLGERISAARRDRALTVYEVFKASGVSIPTINRIEAGSGGVGARNLLAVMHCVGVAEQLLDTEVRDQEALPLHGLHLEDPFVDDAVEDAARLACQRLEKILPPGTRAEVDGLSSNFQGLLADHLRAMLRGEPGHSPSHSPSLKPLVYSDSLLGREYTLKEGANGYLVRMVGTDYVLDRGQFRVARRAHDLFTTWDAAAAAVRQFIELNGYLPGPARIASGWWAGDEMGVRFTAPASDKLG